MNGWLLGTQRGMNTSAFQSHGRPSRGMLSKLPGRKDRHSSMIKERGLMGKGLMAFQGHMRKVRLEQEVGFGS